MCVWERVCLYGRVCAHVGVYKLMEVTFIFHPSKYWYEDILLVGLHKSVLRVTVTKDAWSNWYTPYEVLGTKLGSSLF